MNVEAASGRHVELQAASGRHDSRNAVEPVEPFCVGQPSSLKPKPEHSRNNELSQAVSIAGDCVDSCMVFPNDVVCCDLSLTATAATAEATTATEAICNGLCPCVFLRQTTRALPAERPRVSGEEVPTHVLGQACDGFSDGLIPNEEGGEMGEAAEEQAFKVNPLTVTSGAHVLFPTCDFSTCDSVEHT